MTAARLLVALAFAVPLWGGAWMAGRANGRRFTAAADPEFDQGMSGPLFVVGAVLSTIGAGGFAWVMLG